MAAQQFLDITMLGPKFKPATKAGYAAIAAMIVARLADVLFVILYIHFDRNPVDLIFDTVFVGIVTAGVVIVTLWTLIDWQYQVHNNLRALGNRKLQWSPSWSMWCWLIGPIGSVLLVGMHWISGSDAAFQIYSWSLPRLVTMLLINVSGLILAFLILQQIWRLSDPKTLLGQTENVAQPGLVVAWWACGLAAMLFLFLAQLPAKSAVGLFVPPILAGIAETILACIMILKINVMQDQRIAIVRQMRTAARDSLAS